MTDRLNGEAASGQDRTSFQGLEFASTDCIGEFLDTYESAVRSMTERAHVEGFVTVAEFIDWRRIVVDRPGQD